MARTGVEWRMVRSQQVTIQRFTTESQSHRDHRDHRGIRMGGQKRYVPCFSAFSVTLWLELLADDHGPSQSSSGNRPCGVAKAADTEGRNSRMTTTMA